MVDMLTNYALLPAVLWLCANDGIIARAFLHVCWGA